MKRRRRQLAALVAGAVAIAAPGCGSDDEPEGRPIPQATAAEIERRLDEVQRRYDVATEQGKRGACDDIDRDSYPAIQRAIDGMPADVEADVRSALRASLERLEELTQDGCSNVEEPQTQTQPAPPPPPETLPEPTVPEQTQTEPQPDDKDKQKEEEKDEQDDGGDEGGGNPTPGNGGGGGTPAPPGLQGR